MTPEPAYRSTASDAPASGVGVATGSGADSATGAAALVAPYSWRTLSPTQRGAIFAGWGVLGLLETVRVVSDPASIGVTSIPWSFAIVGNFPWWVAWAALTPVVFAASARFRLDESGWWRRLPLAIGAGALIIAVHLPMALILWFHTNPLPAIRLRGFPQALVAVADNFLPLELLTYAAVVGLFYAMDNHRRLHAGELERARLAALASSLEASAVEARLEALRLELSPHFLFNALNSVAGLVRSNDGAAAVTMLVRLGDLLRISLGRDRAPLVPLDVELGHLELYLDIERQRFSDRLTVTFQIAPATRDCVVPVLCLQPLVENAIKHGVSTRLGAARITLRSALDVTLTQLVISVEDDGPGFPHAPGGPNGIGLRNTRARLTQLYGDQGTLETSAAPAGGALVTVRLPVTWRTEVRTPSGRARA